MKPLRLENRETTGRLSWRIEAKANQADVYLYDQIGKNFWGEGTSAADFVLDLRNLDVAQIDLRINSPGGFIDDALAMFNAIQNHPAHVTAHVEGIAASAASFIAMAADVVLIAPHARMMIHDAMGFVDVFGIMNAASIDDLMEKLVSIRDMLDAESDNIATIYAEKAGGVTSQWRNRMQANGAMGTTYRGQEAVDVGLADAVEEKAPASDHRPRGTRVASTALMAVDPANFNDDSERRSPEEEPEELDADLLSQIKPHGYEPPIPADFTRLIEQNQVAKGATANA